MATIKRFEEMEVWQHAMQLCSLIYEMSASGNLNKDYSLRDQLRKSAISVPSNIAEGYERDSKRQMIYFLVIAKGSCGELRTQLHLTKNLGYIESVTYENLLERCESVSKQLKGFINYLDKQNKVEKN